MLLQSLLQGRFDSVVVSHAGSHFCSCGSVYTDMREVENHLVKHHPRVTLSHCDDDMRQIVADCVSRLKSAIEDVREKEEMKAAAAGGGGTCHQPTAAAQQPRPTTKLREIRPKPGGSGMELQPSHPKRSRKAEVGEKPIPQRTATFQSYLDGGGPYKCVDIPVKTLIVIEEHEDLILGTASGVCGIRGTYFLDFFSKGYFSMDKFPNVFLNHFVFHVFQTFVASNALKLWPTSPP